MSTVETTTEYEDIPQPPEHLFGLLGNLPDVDPNFPVREFWRLQQIYGPIMKMELNPSRIFVSSQALVNEVCDSSRFQKAISSTVVEVRALLGDGLFTAYNEEANWGKAHRLLVPAFGPLGIRKMFGGMQDIASQMILKWDRLGPQHEIECSDDLTRLAFDTIGLCAFSFRFNEFYSEHVHPFASQMADVLIESGKRASRPSLMRPLYRQAERHRLEQVKAMHELCDEIVADRKKHPQPENHDLLNIMLSSADRETGEKLTDENIRFQLATFLVAGHETTSATLSFTYLNLLKNPDKLVKAQAQVDEVLGDSVLTLEMLPRLDYIDACIKETLRLSSPISGSHVSSKEDQVIGGKYLIPKNTPIMINNRLLHRDPLVWDEPEVYKPERWLNGGYQKLPPNCWKPFGTGARACIGRMFAEQEMLINVAMVLQRFQIELADPSYELQLKSTLTIKPWNFRMKVRRRPGRSDSVGIPGDSQHPATEVKSAHEVSKPSGQDHERAISVFFGGISGTCEALAQALQTAADDYGIDATIDSLDAATEHMPSDRPVVIITSSYEGQPPDNAKKFVSWLEALQHSERRLKDVKYAVYGVGNSDWADTYHRIPKLVDNLVAKNGGTQFAKAGFSNVKTDLVGPWEEWLNKLLTALSSREDAAAAKSTVEVSIQKNELARTLGGSLIDYGIVLTNKLLAGIEVGPAKRHLELRLPEHVEYLAGDYLVVQPHNPPESVHRAITLLGLDAYDSFSVSGSSKKHLPKAPVLVGEFLSSAVELSLPVTKHQLEIIASYATAEQSGKLAEIAQQYPSLLEKRYSILDILEEHSVPLPLAQFVDMLSPLTPRQYSISSSPLKQPDTVSLTIDVHESPAFSGHGVFQGVASNYLASRRVGDRVACFVRPTKVGFRIPSPETPLVMMAAGTGIAPMRAFLQERAAIAEAGVRQLGPAILYFGCRDESKDYIYKEELRQWEDLGIVKVKTAFSKQSDEKHHYVPDLVWENREETAKMFQKGGKIFLCGSAARLGKSTAEVCKKIYRERQGKTEEEANEWLQNVKTDRYVSDVY